MKINIGIVGYGNLGKAVEKYVLSNANLNLVAIFSRRVVTSSFNTKVETYENFINYKHCIDVMLLCGGSMSDLEIQTPEILKYFDCINTFDNHKKISTEYEKLNNLAINSNHRLIMSCGWDPGVFSIMRALLYNLGEKNMPITFWGKGISMGHSDALRRVDGVIDGVEFTVPNKDAIKFAKQGKSINNIPKHIRDCYVVSSNSSLNHEIENKIKNIPDYFKGQPTNVNFISNLKLLKLKYNFSHKGEIIQYFKNHNGLKCKMNFKLSISSNPDFTASIMICYINAILNLKNKNVSGCFTPLEIPISYLFYNKKICDILNLFC